MDGGVGETKVILNIGMLTPGDYKTIKDILKLTLSAKELKRVVTVSTPF